MLSTLVVIALYGSLCFANSYLHNFEQIQVSDLATIHPDGFHSTTICDEGAESFQTETPEEICAARCVNAPYFCNSFILTYVEKKLTCLLFRYLAQQVVANLNFYDDPLHHLPSLYKDEGEIHWDYEFRSLYGLISGYDFVTPVSEMSRLFTSSNGCSAWACEKFCKQLNNHRGDCNDFVWLSLRIAGINEKDFGPRSPSVLKQASLSHNLDRKSVISALKSWILPGPKSSTNFDQLVLIFLKLYGPKDKTCYTGVQSRVLVVSFGSGHYVTIAAGESHDEIAYISADGKPDQSSKRIDEACLIYCQQTDRLLGLEKGTTVIRSPPEKTYFSPQDLSQPEPTLQKEIATAVVGRVISAMNYRQFSDLLPVNAIHYMMTFVLSWVYKVRQSDLETEDFHFGSRMLTSMQTLAGKTLVDGTIEN